MEKLRRTALRHRPKMLGPIKPVGVPGEDLCVQKGEIIFRPARAKALIGGGFVGSGGPLRALHCVRLPCVINGSLHARIDVRACVHATDMA